MIHAAKMRELAHAAQEAYWPVLLRQIEQAALKGLTSVTVSLHLPEDQIRALRARGFAVDAQTVSWGLHSNPDTRKPLPPDGLQAELRRTERDLLHRALAVGKTNARAADLLGINRTTLIEKLKRL